MLRIGALSISRLHVRTHLYHKKAEWADGLQHSSSHIVGIGIRGLSPHGTKCWLYYPEGDCPYYR